VAPASNLIGRSGALKLHLAHFSQAIMPATGSLPAMGTMNARKRRCRNVVSNVAMHSAEKNT